MDKQAVRIEEKVHSYIRSNHMLDDCRHIVVGVSVFTGAKLRKLWESTKLLGDFF